MNELVSIITPTYNCGRYIEETIKSILDQTYFNWEMIIVDDCSTDNTQEVVSKYIDERIQYYRLDVNSGPAFARTKAMELAKGDYIAFCDSDDLWVKDKLSKQIVFMKQNDYAISCTSYDQIDEAGNLIGKTIRALNRTDYNRLLLDCPVGNSTVMYDVRKLGKFRVPDIRKRNDDALWLQMLKKEEYIWGMDELLMHYRMRANSVSSNKIQLIKYHWQLYRDIEHLSMVRSIFHVCYWCFIKVLHIK